MNIRVAGSKRAPPGNQPPIVNAGDDRTITLPTATVQLSGTVHDDNLPNPPGRLTTTWTQINGPGTVNFADSHAPATTATFSAAGAYVLELAAFDGEATTRDTVTITVTEQPSGNHRPKIKHVWYKRVAVGELVTFTIVATDPDGDVLTYAMQEPSPDGATFDAEGSHIFHWIPAADQVGRYVLHFTVSDGQASDFELVIVDVRATMTNQRPTVDAGADQRVTFPDHIILSGTAHDDALPNPPGRLTICWQQRSGPGAVTFADPHALATTADVSKPGIYALRLIAFDGQLTAGNEVIIVVDEPPPNNQPPPTNRSPRFEGLKGAYTITVNQPFRLILTATDPDHDPLTFSANWMPERAVLQGNIFTWTPGQGALSVGARTIRFRVSDGKLGEERPVTFTIVSNRPPPPAQSPTPAR